MRQDRLQQWRLVSRLQWRRNRVSAAAADEVFAVQRQRNERRRLLRPTLHALLGHWMEPETRKMIKGVSTRALEVEGGRYTLLHPAIKPHLNWSNRFVTRRSQMSVQAPASVAHTTTEYVLEDCGSCTGTGYSCGKLCPACEGNGKVLVVQPSIKCPRCGGDGRATDRTIYSYPFCTVCYGTGWALVVKKCA